MTLIKCVFIAGIVTLISLFAQSQNSSVFLDKSSNDTTDLIYKEGCMFEIAYTFYNKYGTECFYTYDSPLPEDAKLWEKQEFRKREYEDDNWEITKKKSVESRTITRLKLHVVHTGSEVKNPAYNGCIKYIFYPSVGVARACSFSGLVENKVNIWMTPPSLDLFKILVLNPYPYIKLNSDIGTEWDWSTEVSDNYGDRRWLEWPGKVEISSHYKIDRIEKIDTQYYQGIECIVVESEASSRLGKTYLTAYFNKEIGFVKWDYTNIDKSKMVIEFNRVIESD